MSLATLETVPLPKTTTIGLISLGCSKNLADLEAVLAQFSDTLVVPVEEADVVLLNTCGFLQSARNEAYGHIRKLTHKKVLVMGCMTRLFTDDVLAKYPQIKAVVSNKNYPNMPRIVNQVARGERVLAISEESLTFVPYAGKVQLTPKSYAYVKIGEGCDNKCSYCVIPYLKGKFRSRPKEAIVEEVENLVKKGVKEIILVSQDCGYYGVDLFKEKKLADLLETLALIPGDFWIRMYYIYPERITDELLQVMARYPKICPYFDIPFQHGDPAILKKMYRVSSHQLIFGKIKAIREALPDVSLRTTFILGFPGETEENFQNLLKFVKDIDFDHVGAFMYSREKYTASYDFEGHLPIEVKRERKNAVMGLQQNISLAKHQKLIGRRFKVLIEKYDGKLKQYVGRSQRFGPDIDGVVFVESSKELPLHEFCEVEITKGGVYDLWGKGIL